MSLEVSGRVRCPVCGYDVSMTSKGNIRPHTNYRDGSGPDRKFSRCVGSGTSGIEALKRAALVRRRQALANAIRDAESSRRYRLADYEKAATAFGHSDLMLTNARSALAEFDAANPEFKTEE